MSCRCCGSDSSNSNIVLSSNNVSTDSGSCFWPQFANLPRNTSSGGSCSNRSVSNANASNTNSSDITSSNCCSCCRR